MTALTTLNFVEGMPLIALPDLQAAIEDASGETVKRVLWQAGRLLYAIERANTPARKILGHVLNEVKRRKLHLEWGYPGWGDFLDDMPKLAFVSRRVAEEAMEWANSELMGELEPAQLAALPLTNARMLVKAERAAKAAGASISPEVIEKATTMKPSEFRREMSAEEGMTVKVWVKDKAAGAEIERIMKVLAGLSRPAAKQFADFLESAVLAAYAGDGPDNKIDAVLGYLATSIPVAIKEEGDQALRQWVNGVHDAAWNAEDRA